MKYKTTRKAIIEGYRRIFSIGYCGAQYLLKGESATAYTCGTYGWNFDVYDVDGVALCTGYRGMPGEPVPYGLLHDYEEKARNASPDECRMLVREFVRTLKSLESIKAIYDNGGKTFDRYTVYYGRFTESRTVRFYQCRGMSANPYSPQGFCQYSDGCIGRHNGKKISFEDLPKDCQSVVINDLKGA